MLAEGLAQRVDAETDAELFWGLKGAGGCGKCGNCGTEAGEDGKSWQSKDSEGEREGEKAQNRGITQKCRSHGPVGDGRLSAGLQAYSWKFLQQDVVTRLFHWSWPPAHPDVARLLPAGMFLGVVTEFVLKLHPVPQQLPCITAIYPLHMAPEVSNTKGRQSFCFSVVGHWLPCSFAMWPCCSADTPSRKALSCSA